MATAQFLTESAVVGDISPSDRDFFILIESADVIPIRQREGIIQILKETTLEWIEELETSADDGEYFDFDLYLFKRDIKMPRLVRSYILLVEGLAWSEFRKSPYFQLLLDRLSHAAVISHVYVSRSMEVFDNFYFRQIYFHGAVENENNPSDMSIACLECGEVITLPTHQDSVNEEAAGLVELHRERSPHCAGDLSFTE